MRFKRNSNPEFTPELQIMGDRAEDLGFVWNRWVYPTPAWAIDINKLEYDNPLFNIPTKIWNRELRLWAADCVERTVPVWEEWARENSHNIVALVTKAIKIARDYANDTERQSWQNLTNLYAMSRIAAASSSAVGDNNRMHAIVFSIFHLTEHEAETRSAAQAAYNARQSSIAYREELPWQRAALANRIDAIAPWRLK